MAGAVGRGAALLAAFLLLPGCDPLQAWLRGRSPYTSPITDGEVSPPQVASLSRTASDLVRTLDRGPGHLPAAPASEATVMRVLFRVGPDGVGPPRALYPVLGGTLEADRSRQSRLVRPPDTWLILTDERGEEALYWVPVSRPAVRGEHHPEGGGDGRITVLAEAPDPVVAVRLPFVSRGLVALYPSGDSGRALRPDHILPLPAALPGIKAGAQP